MTGRFRGEPTAKAIRQIRQVKQTAADFDDAN
jgi:hypothetical protein